MTTRRNRDVLLGAATPQTQRADPTQVANHAGGYSFVVPELERLRRFLVTGVDAGTYYVDASRLARETVTHLDQLLAWDHRAVVDEVVAYATAGRAPRQRPLLFAHAYA